MKIHEKNQKIFGKSRRYKQFKVDHRCQRHCGLWWQMGKTSGCRSFFCYLFHILFRLCSVECFFFLVTGANDTSYQYSAGVNNNNRQPWTQISMSSDILTRRANDTGGPLYAGINDTGDQLWVLNIFTKFTKNLERHYGIIMGYSRRYKEMSSILADQ